MEQAPDEGHVAQFDSDEAARYGAPDPDRVAHMPSLRRAATLTAAFGIAFALLYMASYIVARKIPGPTASDAEILSFYTSDGSRRVNLVSLYLQPFSGIAFLWFITALRMWISRGARLENILQANVQLASGLVFTGLMFVGAAALSVVAASVEFSGSVVDPAAARDFPEFGQTVIQVFEPRLAAMFIFTTTAIGRSTGAFPRWLVFISAPLALFLLLSASFNPALVLAFPTWVLVVCVLILHRARQISPEVVLTRRPDPAPLSSPDRPQ